MITGTLKNRKGKITICKFSMTSMGEQSMKLLFSNFYPIHIERGAFDDSFIYSGYSEHFKEIKEGNPIPKYEAVLHYERDSDYEIFSRVEFKLIG